MFLPAVSSRHTKSFSWAASTRLRAPWHHHHHTRQSSLQDVMAVPRGLAKGEARMYYHGLPSGPQLVARSSTAPWAMPQYGLGGAPPRKMLFHVGDHPIVDSWNNNSLFQQRILDILTYHQAEWCSVDVLRIGYEDGDRSHFPVVLFINIHPGSMAWERAYSMACQCRLVLQYYDLYDIECEVKESRLVKLGLPNVLQLEPGTYPTTVRLLHEFSDFIGTSIATIDQEWVEGTRGILLRDTSGSDPEAIYALTCRHVCYRDEEIGELLPGSTTNPLPPKAVIHPGSGSWGEVSQQLHAIERHAAEYCARCQQRVDQGLEITTQQQNKMELVQAQLHEMQSAMALVKERQEPEKRVIGTVAYAPECNIRAHGELGDWCLVRLDPTRFQRPLSELRSRVCNIKLPLECGPEGVYQNVLDLMTENNILDLHGVLPVSEFKQAGTSVTVLGKCGRSTPISFGYLNQAKSIVRHFTPTSSRPNLTTVEWCVISIEEQWKAPCFSRVGDSGSCVWDLSGRVAAMVTAGITGYEGDDDYGLEVAVDVTYVTPMEWLLDDFRACGLQLEMV